MYLLSVVCLFGLTVALPVLPEPPTLPYSRAAAHQDQEFPMNTPKENTASSSVRNNNKEITKDIFPSYKVSIPPPPELPPFDSSKFMKQKTQKVKFYDAVEPEAESLVEVKDPNATKKPINIVYQEFKPIENSKFQEEVQLKPIEEHTYVEEPKFTKKPVRIPIEEHTYVEEPKFTEEPIRIPIEEHTYVEAPKFTEEPVPIKESMYVEKPISVEEPKPAENLESSKVEPKEEPEKPLEDIPVVIQFTVPTTTFLSSIFSKLPSLSNFGIKWPFHLPSIFSRPIQN